MNERGEPTVFVIPIDEDAREDWVLAQAPAFIEDRLEAEGDLASAQTTSWSDIRKEFDQ